MKGQNILLAASVAALMLLAACNGDKAKQNTTTDTVTSTESKVLPDSNKAASGSTDGSQDFGQSLSADASDLNGSESDFQIVVNLATDVLFDFDKADVKPEAEPVLKKLAETIKQKGKGTTKITGFTDSKGDDAYNQQLSQRRAQAIATWLKNNGLANATFLTAGGGERNPVTPNENADGSDNPEGRAKNRRVEVVINKVNKLGK